MVDTTTPLLGLLLQGTGGNNNSWGTNLNDQVITPIENAIAGIAQFGATGGDLTLTADQARNATFTLSGTLTSDLVITVPDTNKVYRIWNLLGGPFFTRLKCATSDTAVSIPAGGTMTTVITLDGVPRRQDRTEVGRYVYDSVAANGDVLECNGAAYKRASLPDLFAKIGGTFGFNDSTDFKVPNAYDTGRFLRSRTAAVAVGTSQTNQNKTHTHTGSGSTTAMSANATHSHTGSGTTDATNTDHTHSGATGAMNSNASHTHSATAAVQAGTTSDVTPGAVQGAANTTIGTSAANIDHTHNFTTNGMNSNTSHAHTYSFTTSTVNIDHTHPYSFTTSNGSADGTEARPESLVGILCIKY